MPDYEVKMLRPELLFSVLLREVPNPTFHLCVCWGGGWSRKGERERENIYDMFAGVWKPEVVIRQFTQLLST